MNETDIMDTTDHDGGTKLVISEILCYFQNKIDCVNHDFLIKTVTDFYCKEDICRAKGILFAECKETDMRLRKYNVDAAKLDSRDIINKLNEVGLECPVFVAKTVAKLPLAAADAFDLAKISNDISNVLKIEE